MRCGNIPCYADGCPKCDPDYREPDLEQVDPLYATLVSAEQFLNAGWQRKSGDIVSPFERLSLRYCIGSTNTTIGLGRAQRAAGDELIAALDKARQRYRSGFYANPFGEPVRRSV